MTIYFINYRSVASAVLKQVFALLRTIPSTSSIVSGSFSPLVSGRKVADKPPSRAEPPNIKNGV